MPLGLWPCSLPLGATQCCHVASAGMQCVLCPHFQIVETGGSGGKSLARGHEAGTVVISRVISTVISCIRTAVYGVCPSHGGGKLRLRESG